MIHKIIVEVLSAWQVIVVGLLIMIILPVVFYFASFDKNPVKIKRNPVQKTPAKKEAAGKSKKASPARKGAAADDEDPPEEEE